MVLFASVASAVAQPVMRVRPAPIVVTRGVAYEHRARPVEVCATVAEHDFARTTCPPGMRIVGVAFASYGTPAGPCGQLALGACHSPESGPAIESRCLGRRSCEVPAENMIFGDPCPTVVRRLSVQVTCAR